MNEYTFGLIGRYRSRGLLVDANILLLHFVGCFDRTLIARFKRTERFSVNDFDVLQSTLARFDRVVTTPNILTEVNSLSNQLWERVRTTYLTAISQRISLLCEEYVTSAEAARMESFSKLGLTDSGIMHLVRDKYLVLTDDLRLCGFLEQGGIDVLNFNHLRPS